MVKDNFTEIGEYQEPIKMRNTIEKMAVWYELRYPDDEIKRVMCNSNKNLISTNDIMFKHNPYIKTLLDENSDISCLDWNEFYNYDVFVKSLPWEERWIFSVNHYPSIVYLNGINEHQPHFHLDINGYITTADEIDTVNASNDEPFCSDDFVGKHIKEAVDILKNNGVILPVKNEIEDAIKNYENREYLKEEFLNCVMYRIIERSNNRIGPRRALIFAKEFK